MSALALFGLATCDYPEFHYKGEAVSSAVKASSSSGQASSANAGGTGGQGGATGKGGSGGAGGGTGCTQIGGTGCPMGQKCTVVDLTTGAIGCGPIGPKKAWQVCNNGDADCGAGLWCDERFKVCKPLCKAAGDCKFDQQGDCFPALDTKSKTINAALKICLPQCEPAEAKPCDTSNSNVTCVRTENGFDCAKSGGKGDGVKCASSVECAPGYVCVGSGGDNACYKWCRSPGSFGGDCGLGYCIGFKTPIKYNGKEYGSCT
jgi:hypothetical protein